MIFPTFREFNLRHEGIAVFDGCEFVDCAKFCIAVGSDETFAHTIAVDTATLCDDRGDGAFVETVGCHD